jgi:hypothetical protein
MKRLTAPVGRIVPDEKILWVIARVRETLLMYSHQNTQNQTGEAKRV